MNSYEALALRKIAKMLEEQLEDKIGALSAGASVTFEQYRYACGYIKAIRDVQEFLDAVDKELRDQ